MAGLILLGAAAVAVRGPLGTVEAGDEIHPAWGADSSQTEVGVAAPELVAELSDVAWDLEYSVVTDQIWFVVGTGETADLLRMEEGEVHVASRLPPGEYSGVHHRLRVTQDGQTVVLNADYAIVTFSPGTGEIKTASFPIEVKDALPGALDPGTPLPGTWVSAFDVANGSVYVARNHVPYVSVLDSTSLETRATIPLPHPYAGARALVASRDKLYVLSADGTVGEFRVDGTLIDEQALEATDLVAAGGRVVAATNVGIVGLDATDLLTSSIAGFDAVLTGVGDGGFAAYDWQSGTIEVVSLGGAREELILPRVALAARDENYRADATVPASLSDLVVSSDGTIWFARADNRTLWRVTGS